MFEQVIRYSFGCDELKAGGKIFILNFDMKTSWTTGT